MRGPIAQAMLASVAVVSACSGPTDPTTADYWLDKLDDRQERKQALKELGSIGDKKAVADLVKWFETPGDWQPDAAYALGQLGDNSVVPTLIKGIQLGVGSARSTETRNQIRVNINVVRALAMLDAQESVGEVVKLLDEADDRVREASMRALGALGNRAATKHLLKIATEDDKMFLRKVAIEMLGEIGDPLAVPLLIRALFEESSGISFYYEARFALVQMGTPAIPKLLDTLLRRNKEVEKIRMADGRPILEGAIEAKAGSVLGALRAKQAEGPMVAAVSKLYARSRKKATTRSRVNIQGAVIELCYALGNLPSPAVVKTLSTIVKDPDPNVRMAAAEALTAAGDPAAVSALLAAAKTGDFAAQQAAIIAASRLGKGSDLAAFDALPGHRSGRTQTDQFKQMVEAERVRLVVTGECGNKASCWRNKLADPNPKVRERAAYQLGWLGAKEAVPDLVTSLEDEEAIVRMAVVLSLARMLDMAELAPEKLRQIYDRWKNKIAFAGVNRELLVLIARLEGKTKPPAKAKPPAK